MRRGTPATRHGQRVAYLLAGAGTAGVYYGLLGIGLLVFGAAMPYLLLAVFSHLVTALLVYPVYRRVVFPVTGRTWLPGFLRFYAVGLGFLATSLVGLPLLVELAGIPVMVAQALLILVSPPSSYVINRGWVFATRGNG
ncbi:GtrA family protein [Actinoallomurus soli]|uniref:GtrA family protein n=1 Tax=Actinoallomurus soli TaxID=2952535 RepID=UPI002093CBF6|nr:GtrA family protein [Actinoallomurus soli]MCO5973010.1 GtrA family protein [Actinoallomurus soli]